MFNEWYIGPYRFVVYGYNDYQLTLGWDNVRQKCIDTITTFPLDTSLDIMQIESITWLKEKMVEWLLEMEDFEQEHNLIKGQ